MKKSDDEIRKMDKTDLIEIVLNVRRLITDEHFAEVKQHITERSPEIEQHECSQYARSFIHGEIETTVI